MKGKIISLLIYLFTLLFACSPKVSCFITSAPPFIPFFPEQVGISYIGPPPLMLPPTNNKIIDEIEVSSQYFKIAVPLVLDRSGKAEALKNLIDEQFTTALDKTKRFMVMDKNSMLNIVNRIYDTGIYAETDSTKSSEKESTKRRSEVESNALDTSINKTKLNLNISDIPSPRITNSSTLNTLTKVEEHKTNKFQFFGKLELDDNLYRQYLELIKPYTDGLLKITITGFDDINKQLDIDYKINSSISDYYILYSGKGKIGFNMAKDAASLTLNRKDIDNIVEEIEHSFPNPDLKTYQIIQINGKKITVNAGKNENIRTGMLGYVVKKDGPRIAYRAWIEVTEVFPDAFNAELKVEPLSKINAKKDEGNRISEEVYNQYKNILNAIKVGELVKMK